MQPVKAKKRLGQHFLHDRHIAGRIADSLQLHEPVEYVLEIGPGTGILTGYLLNNPSIRLKAVEIDPEASAYLHRMWPQLDLIQNDFLKVDLSTLFSTQFSIIGNLPYNISSPIFFSVLRHRQLVKQVVCMVQREVAERIAAGPGTKAYGILSVLLQTFYRVELLFRVAPGAFVPPPKVQSAVLRLTRNDRQSLLCSEVLYFHVVKQAFGVRRKTLRNALKSITLPAVHNDPVWQQYADKRAEQLGVDDFIKVTSLMEQHRAAGHAI
ncbi:MAG: ribosomal RNA small subunit methyltransferase A [Cyclobacteriaceae bacterium]|nr:MAG: ribosomal RNA small subunit methyltransferase A [Cyclobacteriaceae bacterium]